MSKTDKAEQRAFEAYPVLRCYDDFQMVEEDVNKPLREKYQEGYHQAEKDLEPTLEDVEIIINAFLDLCIENKEQGKTKRYTDKEYCQEVLKRFLKERKGELL